MRREPARLLQHFFGQIDADGEERALREQMLVQVADAAADLEEPRACETSLVQPFDELLRRLRQAPLLVEAPVEPREM